MSQDSRSPTQQKDEHGQYVPLYKGSRRQWTNSCSSGSTMGSESESWWSEDTVAVVTGANKGIGFAIVRQLAQKGITTVLTSRDVKRGEEAVKTLVAEGLPVVYHQLDIASAESLQRLADWLKKQYGGVDILINNAGVADPQNSAVLCFNTNYYGLKDVTSRIFPLLRASEAGARVLNVSSRLGLLKLVGNDSVRQRLHNADKLSEEALDDIVQEYYAEIEGDKESPSPVTDYYGLSKAFMIAYIRVLAKKLAARPAGQKIYVNSFCPGLVEPRLSLSNLTGAALMKQQEMLCGKHCYQPTTCPQAFSLLREPNLPSDS